MIRRTRDWPPSPRQCDVVCTLWNGRRCTWPDVRWLSGRECACFWDGRRDEFERNLKELSGRA